MADYRFSANVISRGKGQSSVASAAYRSSSRLVDERTGQIHDYTHKSGVTHSEVLTPEGTPEWMLDRAQLWNAIEAVERRKDAQLSREVQLSLPYELDPEQRKKLVLDFVQEQFVNQGMVADIAIHAPSKAGDERNHHAHIMLTMRELTAEGFGKKNRDWNKSENLTNWREEWAHHQNNALERHGHDVRVDHRSFEDQGIDREATHHLGPIASDMERNGKKTRIGNENQIISNDNSKRVADHIKMAELTAEIRREKLKFKGWEHYKNTELTNAHELTDLDLSQKQHRQKLGLDAELDERHGTLKKTVREELKTIDRRLQSKGIKKALRAVFGRTSNDKLIKANLEKSLFSIEQREQAERQELTRRQSMELKREGRRQNRNKDRLKKGVEKARERREAKNWKPRNEKRHTKAIERPITKKVTVEPANEKTAQVVRKEQKNPTSVVEVNSKGLSRSWLRESRSNDNSRPWHRKKDLTRGRSPDLPKNNKV
ncbi:MAG: MobA/MobL family protein [Flavobacteriaceae bacterium]|nr:MobA/MobL family protein [Flavobacteriaceae bacterium]